MKFSDRSYDNLDTCHDDLIAIMEEAIETSRVDFGINEGHRTLKDQQRYFKAGRSRCDGIKIKSKHQTYPSIAVDVFAYYGGKSRWDDIHMSYLGGHILSVADRLFEEGVVTHRLRWGADWDNDGTLVYDHTLKDLPHFELV